MKEHEALPCPFNHNGYRIKEHPLTILRESIGSFCAHQVFCGCGAKGPTGYSTEEAVKKWNNRG